MSTSERIAAALKFQPETIKEVQDNNTELRGCLNVKGVFDSVWYDEITDKLKANNGKAKEIHDMIIERRKEAIETKAHTTRLICSAVIAFIFVLYMIFINK